MEIFGARYWSGSSIVAVAHAQFACSNGSAGASAGGRRYGLRSRARCDTRDMTAPSTLLKGNQDRRVTPALPLDADGPRIPWGSP